MGYVAAHVARGRRLRLWCPGIHQRRRRVALALARGVENRDDSAGKKGGHHSGPPFFVPFTSCRSGTQPVSAFLAPYCISTCSSAGRHSCHGSTFRCAACRCPGTTSFVTKSRGRHWDQGGQRNDSHPPAKSSVISTFVSPPKVAKNVSVELRGCQWSHRPGRCNLLAPGSPPPCKFEFTGVGITPVRNFTPCDPRKTLTPFRESETPGVSSADFSHLCPPLCTRPVLPVPRTEVPFFRHFSVMRGGIKTYAFGLRKKLSGWPGWPNTGCVLAVRCPRSSPGGHKI